MSIIDELIIDRTGGYYNATDLNRVNDAVRYLRDMLHSYGYRSFVYPREADWTVVGNDPREADLEYYLDNIRKLCDAFIVPPGMPPPPENLKKIKHTDANAIEELLQALDFWIKNMTAEYRYGGETYMGEDDWF